LFQAFSRRPATHFCTASKHQRREDLFTKEVNIPAGTKGKELNISIRKNRNFKETMPI
jgi:hypothetical protein